VRTPAEEKSEELDSLSKMTMLSVVDYATPFFCTKKFIRNGNESRESR
jgi:hypothetical protein